MAERTEHEVQLTDLWREDSAVWEIIAGELMVQHRSAASQDPAALMHRGREHAAEAMSLLAEEDRNQAGHALIGCALALALAARLQSEDPTPMKHYASELAAAISWQSVQPYPADVAAISSMLEGTHEGDLPTLWEVAVRAGAYASGLSADIVRRRQRRDIV
jgi:hypothetical protein